MFKNIASKGRAYHLLKQGAKLFKKKAHPKSYGADLGILVKGGRHHTNSDEEEEEKE